MKVYKVFYEWKYGEEIYGYYSTEEKAIEIVEKLNARSNRPYPYELIKIQ